MTRQDRRRQPTTAELVTRISDRMHTMPTWLEIRAAIIDGHPAWPSSTSFDGDGRGGTSIDPDGVPEPWTPVERAALGGDPTAHDLIAIRVHGRAICDAIDTLHGLIDIGTVERHWDAMCSAVLRLATDIDQPVAAALDAGKRAWWARC